MSPNPDGMSTKHRGARAKAARHASSKRPNTQLVSVEVFPHAEPTQGVPREERIRIAAYLRAERRGFAPGRELADWLCAEAEVDQLIATGTPSLGSVE